MRIIGVDPGFASTGWGIVDSSAEKLVLVDQGIISTKTDMPKADRLFFILESIRKIADKHKPSLAAMENLYFGKNVTSAISVAEGRGVILACFAEKKIPVREFTPNEIKQGVTGYGSAEKDQIQKMVALLLNLDKSPKSDHTADALAAAICAANHSIY